MRTDYSKQICLAWPILFLLNVFTALKGTHFYIFICTLYSGIRLLPRIMQGNKNAYLQENCPFFNEEFNSREISKHHVHDDEE